MIEFTLKALAVLACGLIGLGLYALWLFKDYDARGNPRKRNEED